MEEELVKDVSAEELIRLKRKAARHSASMKKVKNVKDVVIKNPNKFDLRKKFQSTASARPVKTSSYSINEAIGSSRQNKTAFPEQNFESEESQFFHKSSKNVKLNKNVKEIKTKTIADMQKSDFNWLDEFGSMESEVVGLDEKNRNNKSVKSKEKFNAKPLSAKVEAITQNNDDLDLDILEELGVINKSKLAEDKNKSALIFNTKVIKKPITAPVVDAPPDAPLGPRDDINSNYIQNNNSIAQVNSDNKGDGETFNKQKRKFKNRFKLGPFGTKSKQQPKQVVDKFDKEVKHLLFEDPQKEAEIRAENYPDSLEAESKNVDNLDEFSDLEKNNDDIPTDKILNSKNYSQKIAHPKETKPNNKKDTIAKLSNETEQNKNPDMIFTPEAQIIRNIPQKESGYSMIATLTEGGFAFSKNFSDNNLLNRSSKASSMITIEQENKKKALKKYKNQTNWLDVVVILLVIIALIWFLYVAIGK